MLFSGRPEGKVAGSVGPYGACLHDGSEYTGKYIDTVSEQVSISYILDINYLFFASQSKLI